LVQEHELLSSVDSPYTPKELDSGVETFEDESGKKRVYWFAMEMVNGLHLYDEIKQNGPLDYLEWLNLANDLLTAMTAIHQKGIVHSDIKPANIVRNSRKSVLVDFGGSTIAGVQTIGDFGASTLRYSAPEKIQNPGDKEVLGYEIDIFSAGQVLVFAATGHAAWDTNLAYAAVATGADQEASAKKLTRETYLQEIKTREPRISSMNFSQRKIVSMMLKLDPAQRPDANYLLREIKGLLPATSSRKAMEVSGKPMRWIPQYRNAEPGTVFQQGLYSIFGWALTLALAFFTFTIGFLIRYVMFSDQRLYLQSSRRTEYRFITAGSVFSSFGLMGLYFGKQYADLTGRVFYKILGWLGPVVFALSAITVYLSLNHAESWFYLPVLYTSFLTLLIYSLGWGALPKEKLSGQVY
jgi:serine/threonine protein kinase